MATFNHRLPLLWVGLAIFTLSACLSEFLPNGIFEDDAYFYFQIAKNILDLGRSTFDGISTTNGYHPLWMGILVAAAAPLKWAGISLPLAYGACFIAASCMVWLLALSYLEGWAIALGAVLSLYCGLGMETPLAALFLILAFERILSNKSAALWTYMTVATRVDMAIAIVPLVLMTKARDKGSLILAAVLAESSIAAFNWLIAGHFYSVSALIKSGNALSGPVAIAMENFSSAGNLYRYLVVAIIDVGLYYLIRSHAPNGQSDAQRSWWALVVAANAFLLVHTFLSSTRHWYFAPTVLPLLYIWSRLKPKTVAPKNSPKRIDAASASLTVLSGIGLMLFVAYLALNFNDLRASKRFFEAVRQAIPSGRVIYAADGAGYAAWMLNGYSQVIDGDGLVNSFDYLGRIRRSCDIRSYFKESNVQYYLLDSMGGDNCPIACYCMQDGQFRQIVASTSTRKFVSYRLFMITPTS